jgi:hypothetical protein
MRAKKLYAGYLCDLCDQPLYHNDPRKSMVCGICKLKHSMLTRQNDFKAE